MLFGNTALGYTAKDLNKPSNKTAIGSFYKQYLGRAADAGGIAHYQSLMNRGASLSSIKSSIRGSEEARGRISEGIQQASKKALGRSMGTGGLEAYTNAVASGQGSLAQAVESIYGSAEARRYTALQQQESQLQATAAERAFIAQQNEARLAQQRAQMAQNQQQFEAAQAAAKEDAERQVRQMQIASAYGESDPGDVRFSKSAAERKKLLTAGTAGTFGRKGMRIEGLNIKPAVGSASSSFAS